MVTFRFYLVSVIAFFLALAVGVVVGSVLDERISNSLKDRLERVESNLDSTVDLIDQKNDEIKDLNKYADASLPFAVEGRLTGTSTLVVAQSGVDTDQVADTVAALRVAGSATPGVVWIDKSWDPKSADFLSRVREAFVGGARPAAGKVEEQIWSALIKSLGPTGEPYGTSETGTTTEVLPSSETTQPGSETGDDTPQSSLLPVSSWWEQDLLKQLDEQSILRLQAMGDDDSAVGGALNVVIIMGPDSEIRNGNSEIGALARVAASLGIPAVVAEMGSATSNSSDGDSAVKSLLERYQLAKASFVQGADEVAGRVAVVIAMQQAIEGEYGNYGSGALASSLLPAPSGN